MQVKALSFVAFIFLVVPVLTHAQAGSVMSKTKRAEILESLDNGLSREISMTTADWLALDSPFIPIVDEVVVAEVEEVEAAEEEKEAPTRLTDEDALSAIAARFNPIGSLVVGSRGIIRFANGSSMSLNDRFGARINEEDFEIQIVKITSTSVTLQLGEATLEKPFKSDELKSSSRIEKGIAPTGIPEVPKP